VQPLRHAFRFIGASFSLALKHIKLQEPWFTLGLGTLVLLFLWFLPIAAVTAWVGLTPWGLALIGMLSIFALSDLICWGEITALQTARVFVAVNNAEASPDSGPSLKFLFAHTFDIITLVLTFPLILLVQGVKSLVTPDKISADEKTLWLPARTLIIPVIAIEDLSLKAALDRLRQIVKDNLLRFRVDLIRVRLVAAVVEIMLIALGVTLAFVVGLRIADPQTAGPWQRVLAAGIGMLIAWLPTLIGLIFSTYTRTSYATALYEWVQDVATAMKGGKTAKAQPPEILGQVLGTSSRKKKEM
jgi:hypothetical protein